MSELDDIQDILHRFKRVAFEMARLKKKIDELANHSNTCVKDCVNRQKFTERDPHEQDQGCWP